jgi:tricarballylate dehydrogenase
MSDVLEEDERHAITEVPPYSPVDFISDVEKVTGGGNDPQLTEVW